MDVRTAFKPMWWRGKIMNGVKDKEEEGKKAGAVYEITCNTCNKSYIGETGRNAETRANEHRAHGKNEHPELSAVPQLRSMTIPSIGARRSLQERKNKNKTN